MTFKEARAAGNRVKGRRGTIAALLALVLATTFGGAASTRAADEPYELNVIMPLTGTAAFIGKEELIGLNAIEARVNAQGGIAGKPLKFTILDDQSNAQLAVQLLNTVIAKHVPVVLGSSLVAACNAMMPLVAKSGPVVFCFSPGLHPPPGSYTFSSGVSTADQVSVAVRYFRERGWSRIALITTTDATGQDGENAVDRAVAEPDNHVMTIVDREHFNPTDLSVAAQMTRIRQSNPQIVIGWASGSPEGTLLHGASDAGIDVPMFASGANMNYLSMTQYGQYLPKELYFSADPALAPEVVTDRPTRNAVLIYRAALIQAGLKPDLTPTTAWDPALLVIDALKKLGTNVDPERLRSYLANLRGWAGVNGRYDFPAIPQRGVGEPSVIMVRWDPAKDTWVGVSRMGGALVR